MKSIFKSKYLVLALVFSFGITAVIRGNEKLENLFKFPIGVAGLYCIVYFFYWLSTKKKKERTIKQNELNVYDETINDFYYKEVEDDDYYDLYVAGQNYKEKEVKQLIELLDKKRILRKNPEYNYTDEHLLEKYKYHSFCKYYRNCYPDIKFVAEPDNKYDPTAIKIIIEGIHVGYVSINDKNWFNNRKSYNLIFLKVFGGVEKVIHEDKIEIIENKFNLYIRFKNKL